MAPIPRHPVPRVPGRILLNIALLLTLAPPALSAQAARADRVRVGGREFWLSGGNIAWVTFARDVGPGETRLDTFDRIFRELHENGGNTFRFWLHTTGAASPEWSGDTVVGPGQGTIEDLTAILDLARKHQIGIMICLWSFDMLRASNGPVVTDRAHALLTDEAKLQSYIDRSLTPMVTALRGHPGILAWEIFNEPEGMSDEFGWDFNRHVPMSAIQRFINRTAAAIKRADPGALVTNGSWSFRAASDATADLDLLIAGKTARELGAGELEGIRRRLFDRYGHVYTLEETRRLYGTIADWGPNRNYYTDARLIAAGGDPRGVLDFYTVHYYSWGSTQISPFHHDAKFWGLDKPLVVAEFFMDDTFGVPWRELYERLYARGYAGALAWQWFNAYAGRAEGVRNWPRMLDATRRMAESRPDAVKPAPR
jgi:hypothetical protein